MIPTIPGYHGDDPTDARLAVFPMMILRIRAKCGPLQAPGPLRGAGACPVRHCTMLKRLLFCWGGSPEGGGDGGKRGRGKSKSKNDAPKEDAPDPHKAYRARDDGDERTPPASVSPSPGAPAPADPLAREVYEQCSGPGCRVVCCSRAIDDVAAQRVAEGLLASSCQDLVALSLSDNCVGPGGVQALREALRSCAALQEVDLGRNRLGVAGAEHLAQALEAAIFLERLDVSANDIGDAGVRALAASMRTGWFKLRRLCLDGNGISSLGAETLADGLMAATSSLEEVRLRDNQIEDAGAAALAQTLRFCSNLRVLDLDGNRIGDHGVRMVASSLHNSRGLASFHVRGVKLGWPGREAIAQLVALVPAVQVHYNTDRGQPAEFSSPRHSIDGLPTRAPSMARSSPPLATATSGAGAGAGVGASPAPDAGALGRRRKSLGSGRDMFLSKMPGSRAPPELVLAPHLRNLGARESSAATSAAASPDVSNTEGGVAEVAGVRERALAAVSAAVGHAGGDGGVDASEGPPKGSAEMEVQVASESVVSRSRSASLQRLVDAPSPSPTPLTDFAPASSSPVPDSPLRTVPEAAAPAAAAEAKADPTPPSPRSRRASGELRPDGVVPFIDYHSPVSRAPLAVETRPDIDAAAWSSAGAGLGSPRGGEEVDEEATLLAALGLAPAPPPPALPPSPAAPALAGRGVGVPGLAGEDSPGRHLRVSGVGWDAARLRVSGEGHGGVEGRAGPAPGEGQGRGMQSQAVPATDATATPAGEAVAGGGADRPAEAPQPPLPLRGALAELLAAADEYFGVGVGGGEVTLGAGMSVGADAGNKQVVQAQGAGERTGTGAGAGGPETGVESV